MSQRLIFRLRFMVLVMSLSFYFSPSFAQTLNPTRVIGWIVAPQEASDFVGWLRGSVRMLTDYVVRATSPDILSEERHLWMLDLSSQVKCKLTLETGIHEPRWGNDGYILFLADADTNSDGRVDFNDEQLVRVIPQNGGVARTVAQGRSAAWSPNGKMIAVISQGEVRIIDIQGNPIPLGSSSMEGRIVIADRHNPGRTNVIWTLNVQNGIVEELDSELTKKFLWIGAIAPNNSNMAVFPNAQRTDLYVGDPEIPATALNVTRDEYLDLEPSWSPNATRLIYVSSNPASNALCR